ncbi:MAG: hypothetical protein ACRD0P_21230 [Stackebrandtia sp.]
MEATELASVDEARVIVDAVNEFREAERLDVQDFMVVVRGEEPVWTAIGYSQFPVVISGFGGWSDRFVPALTDVVAKVAPNAKLKVWFEYPDDED